MEFCGELFFGCCNYLISVLFCFQIQEIVTTGKLSKLEYFENDEKVYDSSGTSCFASFCASRFN